MNYFRVAAISAGVGMLVFASAASAFVKPNSKPRCFSDGTSTCVISRDAANLTVYSGGYAGVYINAKPNNRRALASAVIAFTANGNVGGGAPRLSIPININGESTPPYYAFLDVAGCGGTANQAATVSTGASNCHVNFMGVDYDNWAEFTTAFPFARLSPAAIPFIIADQPGSYSIFNVDLR